MKTTTAVSPTAAKFKTISVTFSGGICGSLWMPSVKAGKAFRKGSVRGVWGFWQKGDTFREALNSLLCRDGGDFQNPLFTEDTMIRIERRSIEGAGKYTVHVWERTVAELPGCADLVDSEFFTGDFLGECD